MQIILNAFAILFGGCGALAAIAWWPTDAAAQTLGATAYAAPIACLLSGFGACVLFIGMAEALAELEAIRKAVVPSAKPKRHFDWESDLP
jgi:hypothetical protein